MHIYIPLPKISSDQNIRLLCFPCPTINLMKTNECPRGVEWREVGVMQRCGKYPRTRNPSDEINQKNFSNHFVGLCNFINGFSCFKFRVRSAVIFLVAFFKALDDECAVLVSSIRSTQTLLLKRQGGVKRFLPSQRQLSFCQSIHGH